MIRRWLLLIALLLACVVGTLFWARTQPSEQPQTWRAQYFDNVDLAGAAIGAGRYSEIDFVWGSGVPLPSLAADAFSARLDSCLDLDAPLRVAFHLASDDGARLLVDGALLIDNWGVHAWGTKSGNTIMGAGRHHLRVEYFEAGGDAALYLASNPPILDARRLVAPADPFAPSNPCGTAK